MAGEGAVEVVGVVGEGGAVGKFSKGESDENIFGSDFQFLKNQK